MDGMLATLILLSGLKRIDDHLFQHFNLYVFQLLEINAGFSRFVLPKFPQQFFSLIEIGGQIKRKGCLPR
jgi:hypothetical protein